MSKRIFYISFIVPYFKDHMNLMLVMGAIYGAVRMIGAVGLWKNRMWGVGVVSNKLCYYNDFDDVYAARRNNGWTTCRHCFNFNPDTIFWR